MAGGVKMWRRSLALPKPFQGRVHQAQPSKNCSGKTRAEVSWSLVHLGYALRFGGWDWSPPTAPTSLLMGFGLEWPLGQKERSFCPHYLKTRTWYSYPHRRTIRSSWSWICRGFLSFFPLMILRTRVRLPHCTVPGQHSCQHVYGQHL